MPGGEGGHSDMYVPSLPQTQTHPPPPHVQNMSFAAQPLRKAAAAVAAPVVRALNTSAPKLGGGGVSSGYNDYLHAKSMCVPPHPGTQSHVEEPCQSLHLST